MVLVKALQEGSEQALAEVLDSTLASQTKKTPMMVARML